MPPKQPSLEALLQKCAEEPHVLTVSRLSGATETTHTHRGAGIRDYFTEHIHKDPEWDLFPMLAGLDPVDAAAPRILHWSLKNDHVELYYDHRPGVETSGFYIRRLSLATPRWLELRVYKSPAYPEYLFQFIIPRPISHTSPEFIQEDLPWFYTAITWLKRYFYLPPLAKKKYFQFQPTLYFIPEHPKDPDAQARGLFHYTQSVSIVKNKKDPLNGLLNQWAATVHALIDTPVPKVAKPIPVVRTPKPASPPSSSPPSSSRSSFMRMGSPVLPVSPPPKQVMAPPKPEDKQAKQEAKPKPVKPVSPPKKPSPSPQLEILKKTGQTQKSLFKGKVSLGLIIGTLETKVECPSGALANCFKLESLATKPMEFYVSPRNTALYALLNTVMDRKSGLAFQGLYIISSLNYLILETKKSTGMKASRPEYHVFEYKKSGKEMNYSPQPSMLVRKV